MGKKTIYLSLTATMAACLLSTHHVHAATVACPTNNVISVAAGGNIQQAIEAASINGGTVFLAGGTYLVLPGQPLQLYSNVSLCSNGDAIVKMNQSQADFLLTAGNAYTTPKRPANNLAISNIVFDGGIVALYGDHITLKGNTFKNIQQRFVNGSTWAALGAEQSTNLVIDGNKFDKLANGAMSFWDTSKAVVSNNTMTSIYQGISFMAKSIATSSVTISGNSMDGLERMGIELMGDEKGAPRLDGNGVYVLNNRMVNWTAGAAGPIALSIVRGNGAVISGNTAVCGAGCAGWVLPQDSADPVYPYATHQPDNRYCDEPYPAGQTTTWSNVKPSYGIEVSGVGSTSVSKNTLQGFRDGIEIDNPIQTVTISNNAIYGGVTGIAKPGAPAGSTTTAINITGNQIENPRATGISGEWGVVSNTTIRGNLIARQAGVWGAADSLCSFRAITVMPQAAGSNPMVIDGNRVIFEGTPPAGFAASGILLFTVQSGALNGTDIKNNWIGSTTSNKFGNGLLVGYQGSTTGVKLTNNKLQNLAAVSAGVNESYYGTSSGNLAFNMTGSSLFAAKTASVPAVSINPTSYDVTGPATLTWTEASSYLYGTLPDWFMGNGTTVSGVKINEIYSLPANRTVRMLQPLNSGVIAATKASITQK